MCPNTERWSFQETSLTSQGFATRPAPVRCRKPLIYCSSLFPLP
jgi:hypothetical protein